MSNREFLYAYRLTGETGIRQVRAPEGLEQEAVQKALETKHGRQVDLLMLKGTATSADAGIPSLSERETGSATNRDDPHGWTRAIELASQRSQSIGKQSQPSTEIQNSWSRAFEKVREA